MHSQPEFQLSLATNCLPGKQMIWAATSLTSPFLTQWSDLIISPSWLLGVCLDEDTLPCAKQGTAGGEWGPKPG